MRLLLAVLIGVPIAVIVVAIAYFMMFIGWVLLIIGVIAFVITVVYTGLQNVPENVNKKSP